MEIVIIELSIRLESEKLRLKYIINVLLSGSRYIHSGKFKFNKL